MSVFIVDMVKSCKKIRSLRFESFAHRSRGGDWIVKKFNNRKKKLKYLYSWQKWVKL